MAKKKPREIETSMHEGELVFTLKANEDMPHTFTGIVTPTEWKVLKKKADATLKKGKG